MKGPYPWPNLSRWYRGQGCFTKNWD